MFRVNSFLGFDDSRFDHIGIFIYLTFCDDKNYLFFFQIDMLKSKGQLLTLIHNLTNGMIAGKKIPSSKRRATLKAKEPRGYSKFSDVFLVSALNGDGVDDIKVCIYLYSL